MDRPINSQAQDRYKKGFPSGFHDMIAYYYG